jgi:hypothetical protein
LLHYIDQEFVTGGHSPEHPIFIPHGLQATWKAKTSAMDRHTVGASRQLTAIAAALAGHGTQRGPNSAHYQRIELWKRA